MSSIGNVAVAVAHIPAKAVVSSCALRGINIDVTHAGWCHTLEILAVFITATEIKTHFFAKAIMLVRAVHVSCRTIATAGVATHVAAHFFTFASIMTRVFTEPFTTIRTI